MMLSDISVRRPVLAAVGAIMLCVVGLAAFTALPVRELPSVDPPVVSVTTDYRGASAEVVEERITEVIERQIAGIQGIERINSTSRDGTSRINVSFMLDRNINEAANDVRDAVSRVARQLPDQADAPQIAKAIADSQPVMFLSLSSKKLDRLQLTDYADRYLVERLSTVPGVAQVNLFGDQRYAMRIWLDAAAMAARGITVADVEAALNAQNLELPAGALESTAKDFTLRVERGYDTPEDFANLPVTPAGGARSQQEGDGRAVQGGEYVVRLGDVARVEEAPDEQRRAFRSNGVEQISLGVTRQSQANDLDISAGVAREVERIRPSLPPGTSLTVAGDFTAFTRDAIQEVWITMGISMVMVALVNFLFLGTWRAALIPSIVAPICILASFIAMAPLGFSINLLTLLALVLSIGLVVDDAIVVVENVQRRIDEGEPPVVAAQRGARQVFFAVVATTVVLISVFAPLMFMPGYMGKLFVELAVAVVSAVAFSAFLALTLSPMLASKLLRPAQTQGRVARVVDDAMRALRNSYHASLDGLLGRRSASFAAGGLVAALALAALGLFMILPRELTPNEDRGRLSMNVEGPEGASFDSIVPAVRRIETVLEEYRAKGVIDRWGVGQPRFGGNQFNTAFGFIGMTPKDGHGMTSQELASELNRRLADVTSVRFLATPQGGLQRGGSGGGGAGQIELVVGGNDYDEIERWLAPILRAAQSNPGLTRARMDYEPTSPRLIVDVDREKAAALGVSAQEVGQALETMFGSRQVTTYIKNGQEYDVLLQAEREQRQAVTDLAALYVRTDSGATVPLSAVTTTRVRGDTPDRERVDRVRNIDLEAQLTPGYTVGEAVRFLQAEIDKQPPGFTIKWGGAARDYLEAGGAAGLAFGLALLLVFLVLAAQFESWIHPAVIMLTVPVAALGGLFGLLMAGSTVNLYSQIGLIILVGVAAKNGILIVEFANQLRDEGLSVREAVIEAASLRLRPIIMTSIAAAAGAIPLIVWGGAGGESRRTIGVVIFSGAIFATLVTLFIVPVFYNMLARFTKSPQATGRRIEAFEEAEKARAANAAE